jgi:C4-dicarboxylate transporter DctM subunit
MLAISFIVLLVLGIPIAIVLGVSSLVSIYYGSMIPLAIIPQRMFTATDSFPLLAIPLFMLAGALMENGGISKRLISLANTLVGSFTGGFAMAAILTCMFFAAISGSGPATVAAIGGIMIPAMVAKGYDKGFAAALLAVSGAIGIIIPPSIPMVTYGVMSGVSIGNLFTAGFGPGILIGLCLMITTYFLSKKNGWGGEKIPFSIIEVIKALKESIWALLMPVIILGGIYGGIFTPTEAAGVAVIYGLLVGIFIYRELKINIIPKVLVTSARTTAMIMLIISTAQVFGWIMTSERIPDAVARSILGVSDNRFIILLMINLMLLLVGCFMETNAALIILTPIFLPLVVSLGIDPLFFGIIMIANLAVGMATPPLGVNLYVAAGIEGISLERISKAAVPLLISNVVALLLLTFIEPITTFLPNLLK